MPVYTFIPPRAEAAGLPERFSVKARPDEWHFAQEAGYTLMLCALEAVQHGKEDEHA